MPWNPTEPSPSACSPARLIPRGSPASATVTLWDDGATTVTVFPTSEPAAEPSTPGTFTIKRDGDLTDALTVSYTVGGTAVPGVDYVPLSSTVTIPAGEASANITLAPMDDGVLLPDKYVTLTLTNDYNYDVGTPGSASIYITESERPTVTITAPVTSRFPNRASSLGEFRVSRTTTTGNLTVYLAVSGTAMPGLELSAARQSGGDTRRLQFRDPRRDSVPRRDSGSHQNRHFDGAGQHQLQRRRVHTADGGHHGRRHQPGSRRRFLLRHFGCSGKPVARHRRGFERDFRRAGDGGLQGHRRHRSVQPLLTAGGHVDFV